MKAEATSKAAIANRRQQPSMVIPMFEDSDRGRSITHFETMFAGRIGMSAARYVSEISEALPQLLKSLRIQPGDEVIISCMASRSLFAAIESYGARPVLADVDPASLQLCSWSVDAAVTPRTRAVIATHLHGIPCNMLAILGVTACRELLLIEDCTQATGARVLGQPVGSFGHASIFSSGSAYESLELDGPGIIATRDPNALDSFPAEDNPLNAMEAASLYDDFLHKESRSGWRARNAAIYTEMFSSIAEVQLPNTYEDSQPAWERYVIRVPERDALLGWLWEKGIHAEPVQPPPDSFGPIQRMSGRCRGDCYANRVAAQALMLPVADFDSADQIYTVCHEIRSFYRDVDTSARIVPMAGTSFALPFSQMLEKGAGA